MAKELVPHKLIIHFEPDGSFRDGIVLYRIRDNGILTKGYKSIGIKNAGFSVPQFNDFLGKVKNRVRLAEGLKETL